MKAKVLYLMQFDNKNLPFNFNNNISKAYT